MHLTGAPPRQEDIGMNADMILEIRPALTEYLREFEPCMGHRSNRRHLDT
jgi:hypothetical protein